MKKIISLFLSVIMAVSMTAGMNFSVYAQDIDYAQQLIDMIENCNLKDVIYPAYDDKEQMNYMKDLALKIKTDAAKDASIQKLNLNSEEKIVQAISEYVNDHLKYSEWAADRVGYTALRDGFGNCMNYALCCFELCRFAGIEAYEIDAANRGHEIILVHCLGKWSYVDVTGGTRWYTVETIKTSSCNPKGEPYEPVSIRTQMYDMLFSTYLSPDIQKYWSDGQKALCYSPELKDIVYMDKTGKVLAVPENGWYADGFNAAEYKDGKLYLKESYYYKGIRYRGFRTIDSKEYCFTISTLNDSQALDYTHIYISPDIEFVDLNLIEGTRTQFKYNNKVAGSTEPYDIVLATESNPSIGTYELRCTGEATISSDGKTIYCSKQGLIYAAAVSRVTGEVLSRKSYYIACNHTFDNGTVSREPTCYWEGLKEYVCTKCGETKKELIPTISHNGKWDNEYGYIVKRCINEGCYEVVSKLPFTDLADIDYHQYADYIEYTSVKNQFITGTNPPANTVFSPTRAINRAMMVTILYRMAGEPYANGKNPYTSSPFTDITNTGVYYYDAACWALKNGITTETTFKPFDNVTREQTASFLFRYAKDSGTLGDSAYKNVNLSSYPDYNDVHSWSVEALQWANYNGMITGTQQGYINPQGATQRIHATKILYGFGKVCNIGNFA